MIYLETGSFDSAYNLAFEEYCLDEFPIGDGCVILWINDPCVVVGRFQNAWDEANVRYIEENRIPLRRRITGGGAVYHDRGNLNFSVITVGERFDFSPAAVVIKALNDIGVQASMNGRNDITVDGVKVSGVAQCLRNGRSLCHGTLLFDVSIDDMARALSTGTSKFARSGIGSRQARVRNIRGLLPQAEGIFAFRQMLREALNLTDSPSEPDCARINSLKEQKYDSWQWNWGKTPQFTEKKTKRFAWGAVAASLDIADGVIGKCRIEGDFFGSGCEILERGLENIRYRKEDIIKVLDGLHAHEFFWGASKDDIRQIFTQ